MKAVHNVVKKETGYLARICLVLSVVLQLVFASLALLKYMEWRWLLLAGNLFGVAAAVGNFFLMGLSVSAATAMEEKRAKVRMRVSYALRTGMILAVCVAGALVARFLEYTPLVFAVMAPLFFPRVAFALRQRNVEGK